MRKISLCLTTFERWDLLLNSYAQVIDDDRISEIVIVDDHSQAQYIPKLQTLNHGKVKVYFNDINMGVYRNKHRSVQLATNEWVIVFDSDNIMTKAYVDKLYEIEVWDEHTSYLPAKANPKFDYTQFAGMTFTRSNVAQYVKIGQYDCLINTANHFVNRGEYIRLWDGTTEPISADSIYMNMLQLQAGNKLYVVPGLEYDHLVHAGSHYVQNQTRSTHIHKRLMNRLMQMR